MLILMMYICTARVAAGLDFPSAFRQAKILEVGDMTFSISGTRTDFSSEFNDRGARVNGHDLVLRELTWRQFIQESPESERVQLRALQAQKGKLEDDIAIIEKMYSVAERTLIRPFWAFGLSDQWTLGARLSIVAENRLVSQKTEWTSNEETQSRVLGRNQFVSGIGPSAPGDEEGGRQLLEGLSSGVRYHIGDVEILGAYLVNQSPNRSWVLRHALVLPTSPPLDPYSIDPFMTNEGQLDLGLDSLWQWWWGPYWSATASLGYLLQLPDVVAMRVPEKGRLFVDGGIDSDVVRNPGDEVSAELIVFRKLSPSWFIRTGFAFFRREADHFSGRRFEGSRYELLGDHTEAKRQEGRFGITYEMQGLREIWTRSLRLLGAHFDAYVPLWGVNSSANSVFELGVSFAY
ncbi:MAG: hypothetical protein IPJ71_16300 [Bdellovibrionales bacterium]|nr:hypothetical protein [Bdellovibrionales bacterium]